MAIVDRAYAVPPLVAGDVPTADKNHMEWYIGTQYQKTDSIERQVPFTEVVYGISGRQEITVEIPYLSVEDNRGLGDAVLGTKFLFLKEAEGSPGVAGSFELKLANGNQTKELGTGALEYDLRLRSQKAWAWFAGLVNLGYTIVGEPEENGMRQKRRNVWFTAFAQEFEVASETELLSEIYWKSSDEPGATHRLAVDIGFEHHLSPNLTVHAAIGKSLREDNIGGPELRVYAGVKLEVAVSKGE